MLCVKNLKTHCDLMTIYFTLKGVLISLILKCFFFKKKKAGSNSCSCVCVPAVCSQWTQAYGAAPPPVLPDRDSWVTQIFIDVAKLY